MPLSKMAALARNLRGVVSTTLVFNRHLAFRAAALTCQLHCKCPGSHERHFSALTQHTQATTQSKRKYSTELEDPQRNIEERVTAVLVTFDFIDAKKLTLESNFASDLGLDSLDHIEILMAMSEEFGIDIPDQDAERLLRPRDVVLYILDQMSKA
ncbi:acyl carrier protein, mitochondrial [Lingula anatina]|uniref:Acyl carrier protein n=1 Tax=Lingula anatina TaxID=7574 RepID=A0A1S3JX38_LINAN|nr:acyl carrier protein, mitochondrial [Lingula anatina]XP_013414996.1 acyl carrier protein, mitochondrial [Lingula anatina]XP_023932913.1 acyl carrier protein, mitochondrial [Lingula anatina]|eukprot:XP_013414995.1 acyl carrier protein, mitochondrial [Lingula anatina]